MAGGIAAPPEIPRSAATTATTQSSRITGNTRAGMAGSSFDGRSITVRAKIVGTFMEILHPIPLLPVAADGMGADAGTAGVRRETAGQRLRSASADPTADGALNPPLRLAFGDALPLVELALPAGQAQLHLRATPPEVQAQWDERVAFLGRAAAQPVDLASMEEELAAALRIVVEDAAGVIRRDVHVVEPDLAVLDAGERFLDAGPPGAQRLDLRPGEHETGFDCLVDRVLVPRAPVVGDQPFFVSHGSLDDTADADEEQPHHSRGDLPDPRAGLGESAGQCPQPHEQEDDPPAGLEERAEAEGTDAAEVRDVVADDDDGAHPRCEPADH